MVNDGISLVPETVTVAVVSAMSVAESIPVSQLSATARLYVVAEVRDVVPSLFRRVSKPVLSALVKVVEISVVEVTSTSVAVARVWVPPLSPVKVNKERSTSLVAPT